MGVSQYDSEFAEFFEASWDPCLQVGLVSAALSLHPQVGIAFSLPGIADWATVIGGLAASPAMLLRHSRFSIG